MKTSSARLLAVLLSLATGSHAHAGTGRSAQASGPLRVHPTNPRYFTDGTKTADGSLRAVYLTGSHTWNNLIDMDKADPPAPFDFGAYLDFLQRYGHNFIRLWTWDSVTWDTRANGKLGKDFVHHVAPLPWARTGPGNARDGKPKFDLTKFNSTYFDRLRARVRAAGARGIYVSVMLFEGWGLSHADHRIKTSDAWAYRSHPFHPDNNINGITGDLNGDGNALEVHALASGAITALQTAYIRKVVDTVNDLDNVLYEVINEGGNKEWNWWVAQTIKDYERTKPKQHPVGITGHGGERLATMIVSPADWISPGSQDGYRDPPPAWEGRKVSLLDTDHIWGVGGNAAWAWKSFLRGHNPLFMDPYDGSILGERFDPKFEPLRRALGNTRRLAERTNLAAMTPHSELVSTQFCLADPGKEYVVYVPEGSEAKVDLSAVAGPLHVEWMRPVEGTTQEGDEVAGGSERTFKAPFHGDAVLYLRTREESEKIRTGEGQKVFSPSSEIAHWPTATPESQGMSSQKLAALKDSLAARRTTGFLVVRNDKIVYEWYAHGQGPTTKHYTASMAKALVGGVSFGVAMTDGLIALDDRAAKYVPPWRDDPRKSKITLRQLGSHTSGVEDAEADGLPHDKLTGWKGDFWKQPAVPRDPFTLSRDAAPIMFEPGAKIAYSNPGIAMLTYCTTAALRDAPVKDIRTLLRDRVMRPLGVPDSDWSAGYGKTFLVDGLPLVGSWGGGSYTARAVARVGQLMLHEGNWEGRQLLSKEAVRLITSDAGTPGTGGIGWWSNNSGDCAKLPRDAFWGAGAGHQIVLVVPSLKLVAVRNGEVLNAPGDESREFNKPVYHFLFEPLVEAIGD
jgi:CubicO group peptidase (beta-lactamase class C family)